MIPHFEPPFSAEMIRDGGSLALTFGSSAQSFSLFFPLVMDQSYKRLRYDFPVVVNRSLGVEEPISWEHAASWLQRALEELPEDGSIKWARLMLEVAHLRGGLPEGISPIIGGETNDNRSANP